MGASSDDDQTLAGSADALTLLRSDGEKLKSMPLLNYIFQFRHERHWTGAAWQGKLQLNSISDSDLPRG